MTKKVENVKLYGLYYKKGHAVEFIHNGDIQISENDLVGITKVPEEFKGFVMGSEPNKSAIDTLRYLFIKQPEAKMLENL